MVTERARSAALLSVCLVLMPVLAAAAPVADDERAPLDFRRTTLVVSDIEQSLAFYRDALGMVVTYDNLILTPREAESIEAAQRVARLVFLRANDDFIGVLGLIQYLKPDRGSLDIHDKAFHSGTAILVMNHDDARGAFARAVAVAGAKAMWEPAETAYPSYDGSGKIRVLTSGVQDPDGFVIEINELLDALK